MVKHVNDSVRSFFGPGALVSFVLAVLLAVFGLGVPVLLRLRELLSRSRVDETGEADVILVLGKTLDGDTVTASFAQRLEHAAALWRRGLAPRVIVAGGLTGQASRTEAVAGAEYLEAAGLPPEAIIGEGRSRHTLENLWLVREIMRAQGWRRVLLTSDPLHLARAAVLARGLGLDVACSPAPLASPPSRLGRAYRAFTQAFQLHWYYVGVAYSRAIGSRRLLERIT
jgi:uncharacterized SAM-binding protein YcdF (DUF218 family)